MLRPPRSLALVLVLAGCGSGGGSSDSATTGTTSTTSNSAGTTTAATTTAAATTAMGTTQATGEPTTTTTTTATGTTTAATSTQGSSSGGSGGVTAEQLLALTQGCTPVSQGGYKTDDEPDLPADIEVCGLTGAVFWVADMDIDCDGKTTPQCNPQTDPAYQDQTSATDSKGDPLDAANLPYVVVPLPSGVFDYQAAGLELGTVIAVLYQGQLMYGVFGDEGPDNIIGEASYATAQALGIDPDPSTGGTDGPVTYIAFTGPSGVVTTIEDHAEAVQVGEARAAQLLQEN